LGLPVEALSIGGYVSAFQAVFSCHETHIDGAPSSRSRLPGSVATKLFAGRLRWAGWPDAWR